MIWSNFCLPILAAAHFSLLGCQASAPTTIAEALVGGEWTCVQSPASGIDFNSNRITFLPRGNWKNRLSTTFKTPDGDRIEVVSEAHGTFAVEGDKLWVIPAAMDKLSILRNGVAESRPDLMKQAEEDSIEASKTPARIRSLGPNQFVISGRSFGDGDVEQNCAR